MKYQEVLKTINAKHHCPFCREIEQHKIYADEYMYIIPARAPYIADHLLIIPKRHVTLLQELSHKEIVRLHELVDVWATKLHAKHDTVNLLLRDGLVGWVSGKSVNHLHFHLIPDCPIGAEWKDTPERPFLDGQTYSKLIDTIKHIYQ